MHTIMEWPAKNGIESTGACLQNIIHLYTYYMGIVMNRGHRVPITQNNFGSFLEIVCWAILAESCRALPRFWRDLDELSTRRDS